MRTTAREIAISEIVWARGCAWSCSHGSGNMFPENCKETNQKLLGKQATSVSRLLPGRPLGELEMLIDVYSPGIYEKSIAFCR